MLLILPHQLFNVKYLKDYKNEDVLIYEHPQYFKKYKFNKKKLVLHRASMKYYYDYLKKNKFKVKYLEYKKKLPKADYIYFDPVDKIKLKGEMIETPNFILNKEIYDKYRDKTDKFVFNNFYNWSKKEINLYPKLKSKDKFNRKKFKGGKIPKLPSNKSDNKYIKSAIAYVEKNFPKNYGNTDNFIFPVTHKSTKRWLTNFFKKKLKKFGPYQDSVKKGEIYMFHSVLSSIINIGLITPNDIIAVLKKYKSKVPLNSFEGYLRQLFWREYQRYTYINVNWKGKNFFGNKKKLGKKWYTGELGIDPVDDFIVSGFDTGYMHHIGRLMYVGNFMNLSGISPNQGFKWFMEFSTDSYEWVMEQNVRDMVFFSTGGKTTRKPYTTSSNYIINMSDYKKGEWSDKWDELYRKFLKKHKKKLWKFRYNFPSLKKM